MFGFYIVIYSVCLSCWEVSSFTAWGSAWVERIPLYLRYFCELDGNIVCYFWTNALEEPKRRWISDLTQRLLSQRRLMHKFNVLKDGIEEYYV